MNNTKHFASVNIASNDFEEQLESTLLSDNYAFVLKWTRGKKIILLDISVRVDDFTYDIIDVPLLGNDGTISLDLGAISNSRFRVQFRVYAAEPIPKMKAFLINSTKRKRIRTRPAGEAFKTLKKKEIWDEKM